jgi:hypothetical protein
MCNNAKISNVLHNGRKDNGVIKIFRLYLFCLPLILVVFKQSIQKMDFIINTLKNGLPIFVITILGAFILKVYFVSKVKRFDLAEIFFSFFRIYSTDEINMSSNKKRISFMRWNNVLNYYVYIIILLVVLILLITKNT